ncbi:MAG TPA: acetyl-CoA carboxylase biotin carboxyl carrier protein [Solirubrobacteraceae bacterium]|jgi:acetyl-CoA carboxylase biotin carboxyl carrier protein
MALSHDDVREILRIIDESELDELSIETEGFSLHVRKGGGVARAEPPQSVRSAAATRADREPPPGSPPPQADDGLIAIPSPMLGTFYRAESPGATPFVEVGAEVEPDTIVCIIEVMKMMNSVPAGVSGTVTEVCGENGQLVEYGEPLFRVRQP